MHQYFNSILIPVDLSINTELAVKKGLELADKDTAIHLLHVQSNDFSFLSKKLKEIIHFNKHRLQVNTEKCLHEWKISIEDSFPLRAFTWNISADSIQDAIIKKSMQLNVDLIIIGKHSSHNWFPFLNTVNPSQLAQSTGIPVLTAKPGSLHNKVKKVVVPVSAKSVYDKMEIIVALSKKFPIRVYLASMMGSRNEPIGFYASSLLELYRWVKTTIRCPVEYTVLKGGNKAKAILNYAEKINADILVLYPESETKIGWMNSEISDVLPSSTKVEVLTIQPLHSLAI
ncbi:MAG: universal stress protein [Chitinophagaceae bacterium]|nr:universal stress protein [Chitinophagaceae bacterium]